MPTPVLTKGGNKIEWSAENPTLPKGFVGIETDTSYSKTGDGISSWNSIAYDKPYKDFLLKFNGVILVPSLATANAATYSQSGNVITVNNSVAHNIPATTYNGGLIYLAIGTVNTGVAPTSEIANWFTNFQRTGTNTFTCDATNDQTGTGVVNTNLALTTITPVTSNMAPNLITPGDSIKAIGVYSGNNSAGTKVLSFIMAGSVFATQSLTTALVSLITSVQLGVYVKKNRFIRSGTAGIQAIDFSAQQILSLSFQLNTANDYAALETITVYSTN